MQGTQYATKRSILCRGAFCGPTMHAFCRLLIFISKSFSLKKKNVLVIPTECQSVWIRIKPDILSGMICVETVCEGY